MHTLALALLFACSTEPPAAPPPAPIAAPAPAAAPEAPYWVKRTDRELDDTLRSHCEQAVAQDQPLLLVFSAPWCIDCNKVQRLSSESPLKEELERWQKVVIDVGRFDRHAALRSHFKVAGIVHFVASRPADCVTPVTAWPVLDAGTFEPASNPDGARTAADLAEWLARARG